MSMTAPPAPPPVDDSEPVSGSAEADPEALIEEARERARRRRRRYGALALALTLAGVGAYLGLSLGGAAPSASVNFPQPSSPGPMPAPARTFEVWFVRDVGELGPRLFSTTRTTEELRALALARGIHPDDIEYALQPLYNGYEWVLFEALRAGPSQGEASADITSAIPVDTQRLGDVWGLGPSDGSGQYVTTFYLPSEFDSGGSSLSIRLRLAQVVFTMIQGLSATEAIQFRIEPHGRPVDVPASDGTVLHRPVTREDFEDLLPPTYLDETIQPGPLTRQQSERSNGPLHGLPESGGTG